MAVNLIAVVSGGGIGATQDELGGMLSVYDTVAAWLGVAVMPCTTSAKKASLILFMDGKLFNGFNSA